MTKGGKTKMKNPWFAFVAKVREEDNIPGGPPATMAAKKRGKAAYEDFKKSMGYSAASSGGSSKGGSKGGEASSMEAEADYEMGDVERAASKDMTAAQTDTDYEMGDVERAVDKEMGGRRRRRSAKRRSSKKRKGRKTKKNRRSRRR